MNSLHDDLKDGGDEWKRVFDELVSKAYSGKKCDRRAMTEYRKMRSAIAAATLLHPSPTNVKAPTPHW